MSDFATNCREHFDTLLKIREVLLSRHNDGMRNTFQFVASLLALLTILAGFGFTAYPYVQSYIIFFLGEISVIWAILYLIYKLRDNIVGDLVSTEVFLNQNLFKTHEIKNALLENKLEALERLSNEYDKNIMSAELPLEVNVAKDLKESIQNSLLFSGIGIILILVSFFSCSLILLITSSK